MMDEGENVKTYIITRLDDVLFISSAVSYIMPYSI